SIQTSTTMIYTLSLHDALPIYTSFAEFLCRIRMGDERAAAELVSRYEPALRLEIRMRMTDPRLRRLLEPADLCQSVLKSFFVRRSEEHTSELQSRSDLVCRLLL